MIQIDIETMTKLKQALQSMKPFRIECSKTVSPSNLDNVISIEWTKEDNHLNRGVLSVIDGKSMKGIKSLRLTNAYEFVNDSKAIRWTEIFLIKIEEEMNNLEDNNFNLNRFAEMISQATCTALIPLLKDLVLLNQKHLILKKQNHLADENQIAKPKSFDPFRVSLRVEMNKDQVGYQLGMNQSLITEQKYLESLDNELIQILHQANSPNLNIILELVFYVQDRNYTNH